MFTDPLLTVYHPNLQLLFSIKSIQGFLWQYTMAIEGGFMVLPICSQTTCERRRRHTPTCRLWDSPTCRKMHHKRFPFLQAYNRRAMHVATSASVLIRENTSGPRITSWSHRAESSLICIHLQNWQLLCAMSRPVRVLYTYYTCQNHHPAYRRCHLHLQIKAEHRHKLQCI